MGEYARLNKMIADHEEQRAELNEVLMLTEDEEERLGILETIADLEIGIGEIRGALFENAEIDGLDDPYEAFDCDIERR
jgi:hypothetical protein